MNVRVSLKNRAISSFVICGFGLLPDLLVDLLEEVLADSLYFGDSKREEPTGRGVDVSADDFQEVEDDGDLPF